MSQRTTTGKARQPKHKRRYLKLIEPFDSDGKNAVLQIKVISGLRQQKTEVFKYWLDRVPSDFGEAFLMEKQGTGDGPNAEYHVLLDLENGHSCECKGFVKWDHCKHIEGLLALKEAGGI